MTVVKVTTKAITDRFPPRTDEEQYARPVSSICEEPGCGARPEFILFTFVADEDCSAPQAVVCADHRPDHYTDDGGQSP